MSKIISKYSYMVRFIFRYIILMNPLKRKYTIYVTSIIILTFLFTMIRSNENRANQFTFKKKVIKVDINETIEKLISEEDTDGDKKITIEEKLKEDGRGDKRFIIIDENDQIYEIIGTYYLSNLLQELKLLQEKNIEIGEIHTDNIFENPVHRLSRMIREHFWNGLTSAPPTK